MEDKNPIINVVRATTNYDMFSMFSDNRDLKEPNVLKIVTSFKKGKIDSPIIVNEEYKVVDGQHRLEAAKRLGVPIAYIVIPGLTIEDCRRMNAFSSVWNTLTYIDSYAKSGNESYMMLQDLLNKYSNIGLAAVYHAVTGVEDQHKNGRIYQGKFEMTKEQKEHAIQILDYENRFYEISKNIKGSKLQFFLAIEYAYLNESVDNEIMFKAMSTYGETMNGFSKKVDALDVISAQYNKCVKKKSDKIYLRTDYEREMNGTYGWYQKKYGEKQG